MGAGSKLSFAVAGASDGAGGHDVVAVGAGGLTIDTTAQLEVTLAGSYVPQSATTTTPNDRIHLVSWQAGGKTGAFSTSDDKTRVVLPALPAGMRWTRAYVDSAGEVVAGRPGDTNGDGLVNGQDINPFTQALLDMPAYQAAFPLIDPLGNVDVNDDWFVNGQDINPFTALLLAQGGGSSAAAGEPLAVESASTLLGGLSGDANGDGRVDVLDLAVLGQHIDLPGAWTWADGDFTGDGRVDLDDVGSFSTGLNTQGVGWVAPAMTMGARPVPEPQAALATAIGGAMAARRRRRHQ